MDISVADERNPFRGVHQLINECRIINGGRSDNEPIGLKGFMSWVRLQTVSNGDRGAYTPFVPIAVASFSQIRDADSSVRVL